MPDDLIDLAQAVARSSIPARTLRFYIKRGDLPGSRKANPNQRNSAWLVSVAELDGLTNRRNNGELPRTGRRWKKEEVG